MKKGYGQLIIGIIIGLIIGFLIGKQFTGGSPSPTNIPSLTRTEPGNIQKPITSSENPAVPHKVYVVLNYVLAHHQAMDGYVGGRIFQNREQELPETDSNGNPIEYQEWDVNPKIEGENRGTERLVTGSDGRAWYTDNHYKSFVQVK